jgi:hypothetical protein
MSKKSILPKGWDEIDTGKNKGLTKGQKIKLEEKRRLERIKYLESIICPEK